MNCEIIARNLPAIVAGRLAAADLEDCRRHIAACADCADALRGTEATSLLARHEPGPAPAGMLQTIVAELGRQPARRTESAFWLGAGFGGIAAASLVALALSLGWIAMPPAGTPAAPEFYVTVGEPRAMDLAIETDRDLAGADISVLLSGPVELDGYAGQRELSWKSDLKAGINRLSLPVLALDTAGGRVVVRLSHPDSEQVFVVNLRTKA